MGTQKVFMCGCECAFLHSRLRVGKWKISGCTSEGNLVCVNLFAGVAISSKKNQISDLLNLFFIPQFYLLISLSSSFLSLLLFLSLFESCHFPIPPYLHSLGVCSSLYLPTLSPFHHYNYTSPSPTLLLEVCFSRTA